EILKRLKSIAEQFPSSIFGSSRYGKSSYVIGVAGGEGYEMNYLRVQAIELISSIWKDDEDVLAWLQSKALFDQDSSVRFASAKSLATLWKDNPQTFSILKEQALTDNAWHVRANATVQLASGWGASPETFQVLEACIQTDQSPAVRARAVTILEQLIRSDTQSDSSVRLLARNLLDQHKSRLSSENTGTL
ncbi:MAG: HEAT repeat domain-containing protein, partial [Cyanobium sp.]